MSEVRDSIWRMNCLQRSTTTLIIITRKEHIIIIFIFSVCLYSLFILLVCSLLHHIYSTMPRCTSMLASLWLVSATQAFSVPKTNYATVVTVTTAGRISTTTLCSTASADTTNANSESAPGSYKAPLLEINRRRNLAIISHPDSGKTTMTEKLLLYGGAVQQAGAVRQKAEQRATQSDFMQMEQERGISISSTVMNFEYNDKAFVILDTPVRTKTC